MKARPITFSGPMVKALLEGRKSQTRRVVKSPNKHLVCDFSRAWVDENGMMSGEPCLKVPYRLALDKWEKHRDDDTELRIFCPYGGVGSLLWVKESGCLYRRYGQQPGEFQIDYEGVELSWPKLNPRFFPRWASRLTLQIEEVRIQRVQEISDDEAIAEGACGEAWKDSGTILHGKDVMSNPRSWFRSLWDRINGKNAWEANAWVWCITFRVLETSASAKASTEHQGDEPSFQTKTASTKGERTP